MRCLFGRAGYARVTAPACCSCLLLLPLLLGCEIAEDVLVDPSIVWTLVATPYAGRCIKGATLFHIGGEVILILGCLAWIGSLYGVAPVGPCAKRESSYRSDPQIVTGKGYCAVVKLFVVAIAADIRDARLAGPCTSEVAGSCGPHI